MNTENLKKEMKKIKVGHVALLCTGVFLAFAIIGTILIAAGGGWLAGSTFDFHNFKLIGPGTLHEVNDRADIDLAGVDRVVIEAVSDDLTVQSGGEKAVAELKGQCRSLAGPVKLNTKKVGGTVTIEVLYPRTINNSNTRLTVTIPESYAGDLSLKTVSGGISAENLPQKLKSVVLHTVSGNARFGSQSFSDITAETTSGNIRLFGIVGNATVSTVSGDVDLDFSAAAPSTVSTVSGSVSAAVPGNAAFQIDFGSVSGDFRASHPSLDIQHAEHGFKGSMPGATALLKVNTTSGDFTITGK